MRARNTDAGFALVAVLLFLLIVSAIITPFVVTARTDFLLASRSNLSLRQELLADSLFNIIAWQIANKHDTSIGGLNFRSEAMHATCGNQEVTVIVQDQNGLVDLNTADSALLRAGLLAAGFASGDANTLQMMITIYRQANLTGDTINNDRLLYGFKHAPFEAIEELYEFPGFSGVARSKVSSVFTVHSQVQSIAAENMPLHLRREIQGSSPLGQPIVVTGNSRHSFVEINVEVVSSVSNVRAYSSAIVDFRPDADKFAAIRKNNSRPVDLSDPQPFDPNIECAAIFGNHTSLLFNDRNAR